MKFTGGIVDYRPPCKHKINVLFFGKQDYCSSVTAGTAFLTALMALLIQKNCDSFRPSDSYRIRFIWVRAVQTNLSKLSLIVRMLFLSDYFLYQSFKKGQEGKRGCRPPQRMGILTSKKIKGVIFRKAESLLIGYISPAFLTALMALLIQKNCDSFHPSDSYRIRFI